MSACARRTASGVEKLSDARSPVPVNDEPSPLALSLIVHLLYLIYQICENPLNKIIPKVSDCTITLKYLSDNLNATLN